MKVVAGVATDIGRVREGNEDSYLLEPPLYAVADGMGGARGGEVASQLALSTVEDGYLSGHRGLAALVRDANTAVFARSVEDRSVAGMGTTLTAVLVEGDAARLVHVGDSRAYLLRAGTLRQLTEDHTLVQRMVRAGEITRREADVHPHRNVLVRSLGTEPDVEVDEADLGLLEGDRLLLCSDGLTTMITEQQIQAILEAAPAPQDAAERLVRAANRAGGLDNITAVVVEVRGDDADGQDTGVAATVSRPRRPARARRTRWARPSLTRALVAAILSVVVLLAGFSAFRTWLDSRWYVGVTNGHVAVFQGIPATVMGFHLSSVDLETDLPALEIERLQVYTDLPRGINVDTRADALARIEQMRKDLKAAGPAPPVDTAS